MAGAIPHLVRLLGPDAPQGVPQVAAGALSVLVYDNFENAVTIASAGAIPLLVQLLGRGSPALAQKEAAGLLGRLAHWVPELAVRIAAADAIPSLVQLLGPAQVPPQGCQWGDVQSEAAVALICLVEAAADDIKRAGGIPALKSLLRTPGLDLTTRNIASRTLMLLGEGTRTNAQF
jgi:hypothetical protein